MLREAGFLFCDWLAVTFLPPMGFCCSYKGIDSLSAPEAGPLNLSTPDTVGEMILRVGDGLAWGL